MGVAVTVEDVVEVLEEVVEVYVGTMGGGTSAQEVEVEDEPDAGVVEDMEVSELSETPVMMYVEVPVVVLDPRVAVKISTSVEVQDSNTLAEEVGRSPVRVVRLVAVTV